MEEQYRTGGVAKSKIPGNKHVDVTKGYRLPHGYKAVKGDDKNKNYSKGKPKVRVDAGWRLPKGYKAVDAAYNMKYAKGGGLGVTPMSPEEFKSFVKSAKKGDSIDMLKDTFNRGDIKIKYEIKSDVRRTLEKTVISYKFDEENVSGGGVWTYINSESAEENYERLFGGRNLTPVKVKEYEYSSGYEDGGMMAKGGRLTSNEDIIEAFLTSNREAKVGNLSTHYNEYDNQMLLRNYGTLIASRKGNNLDITSIKYSVTTTKITNMVNRMGKDKGLNVKYVEKFADGGNMNDCYCYEIGGL